MPALDLFPAALAYVLENEGEAYVNRPEDHGGPTRYGITQRTLTRHLGRQASPEDVQGLTRELASFIYRAEYWQGLVGERLGHAWVAEALLDAAVLCGVSRAVKLAQATAGVVVDGEMGPKTLSALNSDYGVVLAAGPLPSYAAFTERFVAEYTQFLLGLAVGTQAVFAHGWVLRALRLLRVPR